MEPISAKRRRELLDAAREVLKIELLDRYPVDAEQFAAWQAGDTEKVAASYAAWRDEMAADSAAGVIFKRVRVVSEPLSEYQRMAVEWSGLGVEAGEQLRWLPRRLVSAVPLPGNDCFVMDRTSVMFNVHDGDGVIAENQVSDAPDVLRFCLKAFERAWEMATPHDQYKPG
ncbi:DUF6879 family protein [Spirillospora sp. CA-294931]|uniref:DUF6879 family protein n=1 Tax=Spirillospora sp. CA-294931 TaxID=3240042 RepID=UPI003D8C9DF0